MASNKVASVAMIDIGTSVSNLCGSETFFKRCQWCLLRIIQRKIFSCEKDELGIIIFGNEETGNTLALTSEDGMYDNIYDLCPLEKSNWDMYERVQELTTTDVTNSNWVEALICSLEFLKKQTKGKRFKDKQLIVFSNFAMNLDYDEQKINLLADNFNLDNIKLIVIGVDFEEECEGKEVASQLPGSLELMFSLLDKVENSTSLSFSEIEEDIIFYERKQKMGRFTKVNLTIGSGINIPIRWIKLNLEPTRIKWVRKRTESNSDKKNKPEIRYVMETLKSTKFGNDEIVLNYADMEAMQRQTGPPSCIVLGFVRRQRIDRKMFIGKDLYLVVPEKAPQAQAMISALIDALIEADKFAIVRRITTKNGKIKIGVLIPVSDEIGKVLYFIQLPFAEYSMEVPDVVLPEPNSTEILEAYDELIDSMMIPDKPKDIPMKDPNFQLRCHILNLCQSGLLNKESEEPPLPDFIEKLLHPYPELRENALPSIKKIRSLLPIKFDDEIDGEEEKKKDDGKTSNETVENLFQDAVEISRVSINKPVILKQEDFKEDWETAETQEWPDELKEKFKKPINPNEMPKIPIEEEFLCKNKYEKDYISDKIWKEHGPKVNQNKSYNGKYEDLNKYDSDVQQMLLQRQDTYVEVNTVDMLDRMHCAMDNQS